MNKQTKTYSIQEAATLLKVSTKTLRRWESRGLIIPVRTEGGHRRYSLKEIEQFKNKGKRKEYLKKTVMSAPVPFEHKPSFTAPSVIINEPALLPYAEKTDTVIDREPFIRSVESDVKEEQVISEELPKKNRVHYKSGMLMIVAGFFAIGAAVVSAGIPANIFNANKTSTNTFKTAENTSSNNTSPQVLADTASLDQLTLNISVPTNFRELVTVDNDLEVSGEVTIGNNLNLENGIINTTVAILQLNAATTQTQGNLAIGGTTISSTTDLIIDPAGGGTRIGTTGTPTIDLAGGDLFVSGDLQTAGTTFASTLSINGDAFTDLTGDGLQISGGILQTTLGTTITGGEISDNTIQEVDLSVTNDPTSGQILSYDSSTGGFTWIAGASTLFTDGTGVTYLTDTTEDLTIGSTANLAKIAAVGDTDETQLLARANSTQTSDIFVIEASDATNIFTVGNTGGATITNSGSSNIVFNLAGTGDFVIQDNGTAFVTFTDSGTILANDLSLNNGTITSSGNLTLSPASNFIVSTLDCSGNTNGGALTANASGVISCSNDDGGGGASDWTSGANVVYLQTATNSVNIGGSGDLGKLAVQGDADQVQLLVQGHSTQTNFLGLFEQEAGADVFSIANNGDLVSAGDLAVNGGDITTSATTASIFNSGATTINFAGAAQNLNVGVNGGTMTILSDVTISGTLTTAASNFAADGATTLSPSGTNDVTMNLDADSTLILNGVQSGTASNALCLDGTNNVITCQAAITITLEDAYDNDADGSNTTIALTDEDDSIIFSNPASGGTESGYVLNLDQANIGNVDGLRVTQVGTGDSIEITNSSTGSFLNLMATGGGTTTDGIVISATGVVTDAIDASDAEIVNALNVGANTILGAAAVIDFTNFDVDGSGNVVSSGTVTAATNETVNGIDINAGTVTDVVNLTINSGGDLTIGAIGLNDAGTSNADSGASLVGTFDEFANSNSTNVQDVLDDLDSAIGAGASKWTDGGTITYLTDTAEDVAIGASNTLVAPFSVDVSANLIRFGTGATANAQLDMYASDGDTGSLTYNTSDQFNFTGGDVAIGQALTVTGVISQAYTPAGTLGTANGIALTPVLGVDATDQTLSGINITANTNSNSDSGDVYYGVNVDNITATGSLQYGFRVGGGYDGIAELEGLTANAFETFLTLTDPTADNTITFPDASGTVILSGHTFTSDVTATLGTGGTTALTIAANSVALGTDTTGNYVADVTGSNGITITGTPGEGWTANAEIASSAAGNGLTFSSGVFAVGAGNGISVAADSVAVGLTSTGTTGSTSSSSGLEFASGLLTLLKGCSDNELLTWDNTLDVWKCNSVAGVGAGGDITAVGDVTSGAAFTPTAGNDGTTLYFEGATADGNEIALTSADPGSDISVTLPDIAGTLASLAGTQSFTGAKTFSTTTTFDGSIAANTDTDFSLAGSENVTIANTSASADQLSIAASGITTTGIDALALALTQADDADATDTNSALNIALTSSSGDADTLFGIQFEDFTGGTSVETGIRFGTGFNNLFQIEGNTADGNDTSITFAEPTDVRSIIVPDDSGTICLSSGNCAGGAGGSKWTDAGSVTYLTATSDDLAVGGTTLASAFSVDVSANLVRIGSGATANGQIDLYASDADTGSLTYNTSDQFAFSGGDVLVSQALTVTGAFTLGDTGDTGSIDTSDWDISTAGAMTGISGIANDGSYTQSGSSTNTLTGATTLSGGTTTSRTLAVNSTAQDVASITFTTPADSSGTNVNQGLNITPTIGNATAGTNTANVINVGAVTGDAQVTLNALNIGALTGTGATETAINIGAGWDNILSVAGTPVINGSGEIISTQLTGTLFSTSADSGTSTVEQGDTLAVNGGTTGVDTTLSGDTYTIDLDTTEIGTTTFGSGSAVVWTFDASGGTDTSFTFGNNTQTLTTGTLVLSGTTTLTASSLTAFNCSDCINFDDIADALTLDAATTITRTSTTTSEDSFAYTLVNDGGTAGTDRALVISNGVSTNSAGDVTTEALLLLDQADTTASGNTAVTDALLITNSGGSTLTNGITIGSGSQAITTALNIASTGVTTDISLQNGETIDNNSDGTITLTATNTSLSGDLAINGGNITTALTADSTLTVTGTTTANGTLDANGIFTLGDGGETGAIDTSDWDITATGDMTGIGAITSNGAISFTPGSTDDITFTLDSDSTLVLSGVQSGTATTGLCLNGTNDVITCSTAGSTTLQTAYNADGDGSDTTIELTDEDDSIVFNNPAASGTDSGYILNLDQDAAGAVDALRINQAGSGAGITMTFTASAADALIINNSAGTITDAIDVSDATGITNALNIGANAIVGTTANIDLNNFDVVGGTGNITTAGDIAVNGDDITSDGNLTLAATGYVRIGDTGTPGAATGDDDLYVEGDFEVDATATFDSSITVSGTATLNGTLDANGQLDLGDGGDTLTASATTLAFTSNGAGNDITFTTADDLIINPGDDITTTFLADSQLVIDAATTANTTTGGVIDLNVNAGNAAVIGSNIDFTQNTGAGTGVDATAFNINLTGNDADGDVFGIKVLAAATANATTGTYEAGLTIDNAEDTAASMTDALLITSSGVNNGVTDAIDVSAANINNGINLGANFALFDGIRTFEGSTGTLTFEDTSGNDLATLVDGGTSGSLTVTNTISAQGTSIGLNNDASANNVISFGTGPGAATGDLYWGDKLLCTAASANCGWSAGGSFSSFTAAGDSGGGQTISDGNTLSIVGGTNGIDTVDSATDTITINLDTTEIGTSTFGSGSGIVWTFDASAGTDTSFTFGNNTQTLTTGTLTLSGTTALTGTSLTAFTGGATAIDFTEFDVSATTGGITINDGGDAGSINIESTNLDINDLTFVGAGTIGTGAATGLTLDSGTTGTIAIGTDASAETINLGTGAAAKTVVLGSTNTTSGTTVQSGTGDVTISSADDVIFNLLDNNTDALDIQEGSNNYFNINTTNSSENIALSTNRATGGDAISLTANSITTGVGVGIDANAITSGTALDLSSTSAVVTSGTSIANGGTTLGSLLNVSLTGNSAFSGNLGTIDWSPTSSTIATGDLFQINIGSNGTTTGHLFNISDSGSSLFSVNESQITSALPHQFTAAGDVSIAYDLQFTNQTLSTIKSNAPLTMEAGESYESNNLTLRTYNSGNLIVDLGATAGKMSIGANITPTGLLHVSNTGTATFGKALAIFDQDETQAVFTASASGTSILTMMGGSGGDLIVGADGVNTGANIGGNGVLAYGAVCADDTLDTADDCIDAARTAGTVYGITSSFTVDDIGENFPTADASMEAADIVSLDFKEIPSGANPEEYETEFVKKAPQSDANNVLGIISEKPGVLLGGWKQNRDPRSVKEVAVALSGRVPTKVNSQNGNIAPGDLITVSSVPGVGMRSTNPNDPILGKALDKYENADAGATGSVLVFVNTQWSRGAVALAEQQEESNATDSAQLNDLTARVTSLENDFDLKVNTSLTASDSGILANFAKVDTSSLSVLGDTVLSDTVINGKLNVGAMTFDNVDQSINAIGTLKIQSLALGNIELQGGLVTIDTTGNVVVNTITAQKYKVAGASAGTGILSAGTTEIVITTNMVSANSLIFVTPKQALAYPMAVTEKVEGDHFTVSVSQGENIDIEFDWFIVDKVN